MALPVGTVIRDTYVVDKFLGRGAFGSVYQVRHRFMGLQAVKVFEHASPQVSRDGLIAEAAILASLNHPNLVRIFEANRLDEGLGGNIYIAMEHVSGGTLFQVVEHAVRLQTISAIKVGVQLAEGLSVAHSYRPPIVHRDITLQNILVSDFSSHGTPQVKLADFGLAQHVHPESQMASVAGTIEYLPPEAADGYYTTRSDVYSLGIVLYRLLTGVYPYPLGNNRDLSTRVGVRSAITRRRDPPAPPSEFRLGIPKALDDIALQALAPEPANRYANAAQLRDSLVHLL